MKGGSSIEPQLTLVLNINKVVRIKSSRFDLLVRLFLIEI